MNDKIIINSLNEKFLRIFDTLEQIIENYPYNKLKKNKETLKYLHDLIYQFDLTYVFLNENKDINKNMGNIDGKNIFPEFETGKILTKEEIMDCLNKFIKIIYNWLFQKNDEWLKLPYTYNNKSFPKLPLSFDIVSKLNLNNMCNHLFEKISPVETNFDQTLYTINSLDRIIGNMEKMIKNKQENQCRAQGIVTGLKKNKTHK